MLRNTDVATMMVRVRSTIARARREREDGVLFVELEPVDRYGIDALRANSAITFDLPSGSARPVIGPAIVFAKRILRRSVRWYAKPVAGRQSGINSALLDVNARVGAVASRADAGVNDLLVRLEDMERTIDRMSADVARVSARPSSTGDDDGTQLSAGVQRLLAYSAFEDRHRGSQDVVRPLLVPYLKFFAGCRNVLDLGCGRGEFVALLSEAGIPGYGVDSDESQVKVAQEAGRDVRLADAVDHLRGLRAGDVDGVFSSQVAEHLTTDQLMTTIELAYSKLAPGGVFVIETPNPEALFIFSTFFYVDLTHIKPIHPEAMRWALEVCGFDDVQIVRSQPVPDSARLAPIPAELLTQPGWDVAGQNITKLNDLIYGFQHYAVVGHKAEVGA